MFQTPPIQQNPRTPLTIALDVARAAYAVSVFPEGTSSVFLARERLCYEVELTLLHGLKESVTSFFFRRTRLFDALSILPDSMPRNERQRANEHVSRAKNISKTELGKSRLLIRFTLEDGTMKDWILSLSANSELISKFYEKWSVFSNDTAFSVISDSLSSLAKTGKPFVLPLLSGQQALEMGNDNYWEECRSEVLTLVLPELLSVSKTAESLPPMMPSIRKCQAILYSKILKQQFLLLPPIISHSQSLIRSCSLFSTLISKLKQSAIICCNLIRQRNSFVKFSKTCTSTSQFIGAILFSNQFSKFKSISNGCSLIKSCFNSNLQSSRFHLFVKASTFIQSVIKTSLILRIIPNTLENLQGLIQLKLQTKQLNLEHLSLTSSQVCSILILKSLASTSIISNLINNVSIPLQSLILSQKQRKIFIDNLKQVSIPLQSLIRTCFIKKEFLNRILSSNNLSGLLFCNIKRTNSNKAFLLLKNSTLITQSLLQTHFKYRTQFQSIQEASSKIQAVSRSSSSLLSFLIHDISCSMICGLINCKLEMPKYLAVLNSAKFIQTQLQSLPLYSKYKALKQTTILTQNIIHDLVFSRRNLYSREKQMLHNLMRTSKIKPASEGEERETQTIGGTSGISIINSYSNGNDGKSDDEDDDGDNEMTHSVTLMKQRPVWVPDNSSDACGSCGKKFNFFTNRKHHCRSCGSLICSNCTVLRSLVSLGYNSPVRICKRCVVHLFYS